MKLSVIGMGKLGLPMATLFASKGHDVVGVDSNIALVKAINEGRCVYYEPNLQEVMSSLDGNLKADVDYKPLVDTAITFVIVPTPSDPDGNFTNKYIESACRSIGQALKGKRGYHMVVITSTVMPGSMAEVIMPTLEYESGKVCGKDLGICYNPEFIALGAVLKGMEYPDAILIGESDKHTGDLLEQFYASICPNSPPVCRMNWANAEVSKLMLNVFITTKISLVNTFAEVCEKIPGGDIDAVTNFLGHDKRVGHKYLKGGLAYGGPCFPRDCRAFGNIVRSLDAIADIQSATDEVNAYQTERLLYKVMHIDEGPIKGTVAILGLTYKPHTSVVEEAPGLILATELNKIKVRCRCYDPAGMSSAEHELSGDYITYTGSVADCVKGADLCVVTMPWPEFEGLKPIDLKGMRSKMLLDCWRMFNRDEWVKGGFSYYAIGKNTDY